MNTNIYNNLGIYSIGILSCLNLSRTLSLPELTLIGPFITHNQLLNYLSRKNIDVKSLVQLIVKNPRCFSNFNERYYSSLTGTMNAIQFLCDIELISWNGRYCSIVEDFPYDKAMGKRADKIYKSSRNIVKLIFQDVANAYTNLRIQL